MPDSLENPAALNQAGLEALCQAEPWHAQRLFQRAFVAAPTELGLLVNVRLALQQTGRDQAASRSYMAASQQPSCRGSALKNLGFLKLWQGEPVAGWDLHHQRFNQPELMARHWQGEPVDTPLVVWNDVGQGDAIQFSRYLPLLVRRGLRVHLAVQPNLIPLFAANLPAGITVISHHDAPWEQADAHLPLMGLMRQLDADLGWGSNHVQPYLTADGEANDLPPRSGRGRLGLCWRSNPEDRSLYLSKSMPLAALWGHAGWQEPLEHLDLISLQRGAQAEHRQWASRFAAVLPERAGWLHTARWIASCDWVLSVDTAVAHLAD